MTPPSNPLNYESPPDQRPPNVPLQATLGSALAAGVMWCGVVVGNMMRAANQMSYKASTVPASNPSRQTMTLVYVGIVLAMTICLTGFALLLRRRPWLRGLQIGIWIGIAIGWLMAGYCYTLVN